MLTPHLQKHITFTLLLIVWNNEVLKYTNVLYKNEIDFVILNSSAYIFSFWNVHLKLIFFFDFLTNFHSRSLSPSGFCLLCSNLESCSSLIIWKNSFSAFIIGSSSSSSPSPFWSEKCHSYNFLLKIFASIINTHSNLLATTILVQ